MAYSLVPCIELGIAVKNTPIIRHSSCTAALNSQERIPIVYDDLAGPHAFITSVCLAGSCACATNSCLAGPYACVTGTIFETAACLLHA